MALRQLLERDGITPDDIGPVLLHGGWTAAADIPDVQIEHVHAWAQKDGTWWCEPGKHGYDGPEPVARATDPQTSWDAAKSVKGLTQTREAILGLLRALPEGRTDEEIWKALPAERTTLSGMRTRRAELVDMGLVKDSGKRVTGRTGRKMIVWEAARGDQG